MSAVASKTRRPAWIAPAAAMAVVLFVLLVLALGGREPDTPSPPPPSAGAAPASARSSDNAVAAAARWLDAVDTRQELLDDQHIKRAVEAMVAPEARDEMAQRLSAARDQLRAGDRLPPTVRSAPVGYRVVSLEEARAVVGTWEIIARSAPDIAPSVLWARSELTFVWEDGWKLAATQVRLDRPAELPFSTVARMDAAYRSFRHAP